MVRRVMKDAFVVWKNSRSIFGLTNYFAGQPRVAGAILSILFGLFLSACGGGGAGSPPNVATTVTPPLVIDPITPTPDVTPPLVIDPITPTPDVTPPPPPPPLPIFVDAPVQGLHYRPVGSVTLIPPSRETSADGEFDPSYRQLNFGTIAFAVGEITVDGDGLTLSQYKSNGFLGFIVHPAEEWQNGVFTPYDLRTTLLTDASTVRAGTVNVGAVARVLQGFDQTPPSTSPVGFNVDDNLILIHLGATAGRTVIIDQSSPAGEFSVQELDETGTVSTSIVMDEDNYTVVISMALKTENSPGYGGATLRFPLHSNAMETLSMVIADMADEIAPFSDNSTITLNSRDSRTRYFARRGAYSLIYSGLTNITIDSNTGSISIAVTSGEPPENVSVVFQYADQISLNQAVELNALPALKTDAKDFQIYFTGGKYVALTLTVVKGGNAPLRYKLTSLSELDTYGLELDHESGILFGTPQQEAFVADVALDVADDGGDEVVQDKPDLEFQIVSREGAPAYYEIDLTGGPGSSDMLHFPDRKGNDFYKKLTEESIAGIDSTNCQAGVEPNIVADFGASNSNCPYSADYVSGGASGVMVKVGLKSTISVSPANVTSTICAGAESKCPAGVKVFTVSFINDLDGFPVRVLLPRPAFDPAFASENFATYIQDSPNPSRRPLPAADGGNGRLIYSVIPPPGLTLHSATRRLLGRPTVIVSGDMDISYPLMMTVTDSNGNDGDSAVYPFTVVVQKDRKPAFASDAETVFIANLSVATTLTLPEIIATITLNRATIYSVSDNIPRGMTFDLTTRQLSGTPTTLGRFLGRFSIIYVATDPDEELDEDGEQITPMTLRVGDDDKATLTVVVFVDDKPNFGDSVPVQSYTVTASSPITAELTLPEARGGNPPLMFTLTDLMGGDNLAGLSLSLSLSLNSARVPARALLSGTPEGEGRIITLIYKVTDTDLPEDSNDSAALSITVNIVGDATPMFADAMVDPITLTATWPIEQPIILPTVTINGNGATKYSTMPQFLPNGLTLNTVNMRGELSGTPTVSGVFTITLIASDSDLNFDTSNIGGDIDKLPFTITVVPDTTPVFSDSVVDQNYIENSPITNLTLPVATGGNGSVTMYSLTPRPTGLTFNADPNSRVLSGTPRVTGNYTLNYIATDSDPVNPDSALTSFMISIEADTAPFFAESVPQQNYFQGASIMMTLLPVAIGGNGDLPLTYRYSGLPTGITITFNSADRELTLSGTPTEPGSFVATIVAMDTDGNTDESDNGVLTFGISVEADTRPSFGSLTVFNQTYTLSVRISPLRLPAATGGNGQLIYSVSDDLPPGLAFNDNTQTDNTRIINLTPTTAGTYTVVYTVEDGDGDTRSLTFTITVVDPPPSP